MSELATLQRWFTSIIIRPGKLHEKILAADRRFEIDNTETIRSSPGMPGHERIQIYARGYVLRLMECLRADYPALRNLLGDELFDTFAQAYLVHKPSDSYSLFDLGNSFPDFLRASRPDLTALPPDERTKFDLPVELALLERAKADVYRSRGVEEKEEDMLYESAGFFFFENDTLRTSPCLRLLKLQFPLIDFVKAVERGERPPVPQVHPELVAVGRKNYVIHMQALEPWQWHFLAALGNTGDYMQAIRTGAALSGTPEEAVLADLMLWTPVAFELGYMCRG